MDNEYIKKAFIKIMEEIHQGLVYPKQFFGCLIAVFIEQKSMTQDRIVDLTEYSKSMVSQMLKLIQMNFQLDKIKEPKIRKKYYKFSLSPKEFMLQFFRFLIDEYVEKPNFIAPLIEEISPYVKEHVRFQNFYSFLNKFQEMANLYIHLFEETKEELSSLILNGSISGSSLIDNTSLQAPENAVFIQNLMKPPNTEEFTEFPPFQSSDLSNLYLRFKAKFFQQFQATLQVNASQVMKARTILGTELLLENRPMTQEELEKSTNFARSLISDTLNLLLNYKMIRVMKRPQDRKKYYIMNQSWDVRTINRLRLNVRYANSTSALITKLIQKFFPDFSANDNLSENSMALILSQVLESYKNLEQYYKYLESKYLNIRLKEHLESK